jgi:predicted nucleic-acid-binding protein
LLEVQVLIVEREREVYAALRLLKDGRGSFADGLVAALGHSAECEFTYTFDKKATRITQFKHL